MAGAKGRAESLTVRVTRRRRVQVLLVAGWISLGAQSGWPDVPPGHWAAPAVAELENQGLVAGFPNGRFEGRRRLTRYETAALLLRAQSRLQGWASLQVSRPSSARPWQDLATDHWARAVVRTTVDRFGWLSAWPGLALGRFQGQNEATRYEVAIAVASLLPVDSPESPACETGTPAWATEAVARVIRRGVMVGDPDGAFHGGRSVSRYEAAVAVAKAMAIATAVPAPPPLALPDLPAPNVPPTPPLDLPVPVVTAKPVNLPRLSLGFIPEYLSELAGAQRGEANGWAMAASQLQADWADGPLALTASWRYAMYSLQRAQGIILPRRDQQLQVGAGYRWQWGQGERRGDLSVYGLGSYLGRQGGGATATDDLLALDLQAFGLGTGAQWRWPVAPRLVATARAEYLPVMGAQFGPQGAVSGQLGLVSAGFGLDWYLHRLSVGAGYRLRYLYDGQRQYSQWGNGLVFQASLAF